MTLYPIIARRTALTAGVAGAGAVALAACSSSASSTKAATTKAATTTSAQSTPVQSTPAQSTSAQSASGQKQTVAKLADIKVGEAIAAKIDGKDVLVSRPTASSAACFSAICTHQGCTVKPAGTQLQCPCHHSVYDAKTGAVLSGPAPAPLNKIAVSVDKGEIVTG